MNATLVMPTHQTSLLFLAAVVVPQAIIAGTPTAPAPAPDTSFKPLITRSVAENRSPFVPEYAHPLSNEVNWLDVGVESRTRYEQRWHDYTTASLRTDDALVTRNFAYLGIRQALDPLRLVVEMEDSRRFLSDRAPDERYENEWDLLQAYAQLYFADAINGEALSLSVGRMAFDAIDRRLLERTRNRNAMTNFDGVRLRLGDEQSRTEWDAFALRHVERDVARLDESTSRSTLYGLTAYFRDLAPGFVIEPYWLWLDQRREHELDQRKNLHTVGLHSFGVWGAKDAWDYDLDVAGQWGTSKGLDHRAAALHLEGGHTWVDTPWKPRLALWFNYSTGDRDPNDTRSERFDSLFGDNFSFYSFAGYFTWQNMINPALRLSLNPTKRLRCEIIPRAVWLASDSDAWVRGNRRDVTGGAGSFVGQELDARIIWRLCENFELDAAYGHLFPGTFTDRTGASPQGDFVQVAATLRF